MSREWSSRDRGEEELRKTGSDPGRVVVVVVSEERAGSSEMMCWVCWRDETTSRTVVSCGVSRERDEAWVVVVRRREIVTTERREKTRGKAIVSGEYSELKWKRKERRNVLLIGK